MFISYRLPEDSSSKFLNIRDVLKKEDFNEVRKIYETIFHSATAYDPTRVESFAEIEKALYKRLIHLVLSQVDFDRFGCVKAPGLSDRK